MATSFADILRQQQAAQQAQQNNNAQIGNALGQAGELGGKAIAGFLRGKPTGAGAMGQFVGQMGMGGQQEPNKGKAIGGAIGSLAGTAFGGPVGGVLGGQIGSMVGDKVDFNKVWGNLGDGVKSIFKVF